MTNEQAETLREILRAILDADRQPRARDRLVSRITETVRSASLEEIHALLETHAVSLAKISDDDRKETVFVERTLDRFLAGSAITESNLVFIYYFVAKYYENDIVSSESFYVMRLDETLVNSLRSLFNKRIGIPRGELAPFWGKYELVHAYQMDPAKVIVASLAIGTGSNHSRHLRVCDVVLKYDYEFDGFRQQQEFFGKIVPHGSTATLLLTDRQGSKFFFYIDSWAGSDVRARLSGTLLGHLEGPARSSAWAFAARRLPEGEKAQPRLVEMQNIPEWMQREIARGIVQWEPPVRRA